MNNYKNMEDKPAFPYDPKWESVEFKAPEKKIVAFNDVEVFQKGKTHAEYLRFLGMLQEVIPTLLSQSNASPSVGQAKSISSKYSSRTLHNCISS